MLLAALAAGPGGEVAPQASPSPVIAAAPMARITVGSGVRLRATAGPAGTELARLPLGSEVVQLEQGAGPKGEPWFRVRLADGREGWVAGSVTRPLDPARRAEELLKLATERLLLPALPLAERSDLVVFLDRVIPTVTDRTAAARLAWLRLQAIQVSIEGVGYSGDPGEEAWLRQLGERVFEGEGGYAIADAVLAETAALARGTPLADVVTWSVLRLRYPCEGYDIYDGCSLDARAEDASYLREQPAGAFVSAELSELEDVLWGVRLGDMSAHTEAITTLRAAVAGVKDPRRERLLAGLDQLWPKVGGLRVLVEPETGLRPSPSVDSPAGPAIQVGETLTVVEVAQREAATWLRVSHGGASGWLPAGDTLPFQAADPSWSLVGYGKVLWSAAVGGDSRYGSDQAIAELLALLARQATDREASLWLESLRLSVIDDSVRNLPTGEATPPALLAAWPGEVALHGKAWRVNPQVVAALVKRADGLSVAEALDGDWLWTLRQYESAAGEAAQLRADVALLGPHLRAWPAGSETLSLLDLVDWPLRTAAMERWAKGESPGDPPDPTLLRTLRDHLAACPTLEAELLRARIDRLLGLMGAARPPG